MLIPGLNHLSDLLVYSWFCSSFFYPKNIEALRWLVHYFFKSCSDRVQNSGTNKGSRISALAPCLRDICRNRPRRTSNLISQRIPFFHRKSLGCFKYLHSEIHCFLPDFQFFERSYVG